MRGVAFRGKSIAEVIDYPDLSPAPDQVLIKLRSSGLCGSDFMRYRDDNPNTHNCLLYTSPSPRDLSTSRMPSSA